jgi:hypothetical protein
MPCSERSSDWPARRRASPFFLARGERCVALGRDAHGDRGVRRPPGNGGREITKPLGIFEAGIDDRLIELPPRLIEKQLDRRRIDTRPLEQRIPSIYKGRGFVEFVVADAPHNGVSAVQQLFGRFRLRLTSQGDVGSP